MTDPISLSASEHQLQLRRAVIASTIGTAIEWYDFFLYNTLTGLVFAKLLFSHSDPWVGMLEAFAIYAGVSWRWAQLFSATMVTFIGSPHGCSRPSNPPPRSQSISRCAPSSRSAQPPR
jgi:hypothetical protein